MEYKRFWLEQTHLRLFNSSCVAAMCCPKQICCRTAVNKTAAKHCRMPGSPDGADGICLRCYMGSTWVLRRFMAAMNIPGGGKNDIPNRLKRQFSLFHVPLPSSAAINNIFGALVQVSSRMHGPCMRTLPRTLAA